MFSVFQELFNHLGTSFLDGNFTTVQRLTEFLSSGERPLGYQVEMKNKVSRKSEYKTKLFYSSDDSERYYHLHLYKSHDDV